MINERNEEKGRPKERPCLRRGRSDLADEVERGRERRVARAPLGGADFAGVGGDVLRSLETHAALNAATNGAMREAVRHIVGVQFRNCATVGGSVYGRFGFSDVLTLLLALDCDVELYKAGRMPIAQFAALPYDRDILTHVYIKKTPGLAVHYQSVRATQTDFPILTCAAARTADGAYRFAIGARPMKAMLVCPTAAPDELPAAVQAAVPTGSNLRGSAAYRTHLVGVLVKRAVQALGNLEVL